MAAERGNVTFCRQAKTIWRLKPFLINFSPSSVCVGKNSRLGICLVTVSRIYSITMQLETRQTEKGYYIFKLGKEYFQIKIILLAKFQHQFEK